MDLRSRFARLYLGVVYDAMRFDLELRQSFVLDRHIRPVWAPAAKDVLFGEAFTCRGERLQSAAHLDDTIRIKMFRSFKPGCVQVIDTNADDTVAHFGDISGKLARKFGAVGAVIDGYSRDVRILEEDRFPVFCRGAQPQDAYGRWQIVAYQEPISLTGPEGRVLVHPGDFIFGDPDGVIVIPHRLGENVCSLAEKRLEREDQVRRELLATEDVEDLYQRIGRW